MTRTLVLGEVMSYRVFGTAVYYQGKPRKKDPFVTAMTKVQDSVGSCCSHSTYIDNTVHFHSLFRDHCMERAQRMSTLLFILSLSRK